MKTRPSLLDWSFIHEMAVRMTVGVEKHDKGSTTPNYLTMDESELKDKLLRHTISEASGNLIDQETQQAELVAIACNAMMLWARRYKAKKDTATRPCAVRFKHLPCILAPHQHDEWNDTKGAKHCARAPDGEIWFWDYAPGVAP